MEAIDIFKSTNMDKKTPIKVKGVEVAPRDVIAAAAPDPNEIGKKYVGQTAAGTWVRGKKDGMVREAYLYQIADNQECVQKYGTQVVVAQTAFTPAIWLELLGTGKVQGYKGNPETGVHMPEEFSADDYVGSHARATSSRAACSRWTPSTSATRTTRASRRRSASRRRRHRLPARGRPSPCGAAGRSVSGVIAHARRRRMIAAAVGAAAVVVAVVLLVLRRRGRKRRNEPSAPRDRRQRTWQDRRLRSGSWSGDCRGLQNRLRGGDPVLGGFDSHVAPPPHFAGLCALRGRSAGRRLQRRQRSICPRIARAVCQVNSAAIFSPASSCIPGMTWL